MPRQARLGDKVNMNCPHGGIGIIVSGDDFTSTDTKRAARLGDTVVCQKCGKSGTIVEGSPNVFISGKNAARVGDHESGTCDPGLCEFCPHSRHGIIIEGSGTVFIND